MPQKLVTGILQAPFQPQQGEEAVDLKLGERFKTVVVDFNADTAAVDVGRISPFTHTGMVSPQQIIQHMVHGPVAANHIMGAHLRTGKRKGLQGLVTAVSARCDGSPHSWGGAA